MKKNFIGHWIGKTAVTMLCVCGLIIGVAPVAFAQTIITSPIDGRPISTDYLENLTHIADDTFLCVDKANLDFYSAIEQNNYKANSRNVRQEIREMVQANDSSDTTVILNTSSYFTNGLVSGRCGVNYKELQEGLDDLYALLTDHPMPTYYVNLVMPRTLPETRLNKIWRDNEKRYGLAFYYLKYHPDTPLKSDVYKNFRRVTPSQYLLEYGYVENKRAELGEQALTEWEAEFLKVFKQDAVYEPYMSDIYRYKLPYRSVSEIFTKLIKWQDAGLIDEIVVSSDDFQLPDFILYLFRNAENEITADQGKPIKYSFARTYMSTGLLSLTRQLTLDRGEAVTQKALRGENDTVNFLFGVDEVPQLIYARDLAKRKNLSTDFSVHTNTTAKDKNNIAKFDVIGVNDLLQHDISFVSSAKTKTAKPMDFYLYNYNDTTQPKIDNTLSMMKQSWADGHAVSLVEIYSEAMLNTGDNALFKTLLSQQLVPSLASYSAWNTNANAIGLGVAHASVYGVATETTKDDAQFQTAQTKMLLQHLIEDGLYTIETKRALSNAHYIPPEHDIKNFSNDQTLYDALKPERVLDVFNQASEMEVSLKRYYFPWGRTFECYLDFDCTPKIEKTEPN